MSVLKPPKDLDFPIHEQFTPNQKITLIEIPKNAQTSYLPQSKNPSFITASNSTTYCNPEIIKILNLLLKTQPHVIRSIFSSDSEEYYACRLFHEGGMKVVSVDCVFPFDSNFYPLFGGVQQYIWFSVLIKALAKLFSSFKKINELTFKDMFKLLTNSELKNIQPTLEDSQHPYKQLSSILKTARIILVQEGQVFFQLQKLVYRKSESE